MQTIQAMMENTFRHCMEKPAIIRGKDIISYRELRRMADKVTAYLLAHEVKQGQKIGIFVTDTVNLVASIIGILAAKCVFVPLNISYPPTRIQKYLDFISCSTLIIDQETFLLNFNGPQIILFSEISKSCEKDAQLPEISSYSPEDPIYVYFTSGTTQAPKAILGKNIGLAHFIQWEIQELSLDEEVRVSQLTPPNHDPFLRDIFVPLVVGGTICLPEFPTSFMSPLDLVKYLEQEKVELLHITPSLFRVVASQAVQIQTRFEHLKYICLAGETIYPKDLFEWYKHYGNRIHVLNLYGPTETALAKLYYWINPEDVYRSSIPVGRPIKDTAVVILDDNMSACAPGQIGELYIRTSFGTYGYINAPQLMSNSFVVNPLTHSKTDILYRTGDLARYNSQGEIELAGRRDRQIKLRGFRVELDEIEGVLHEYPSIENVAVIAMEQNSSIDLMAFYVVGHQTDDTTKEIQEDLKNYLKNRLPDYMCPVHFCRVEVMPLTANGKIDYVALTAMGKVKLESPIMDHPNTETEEILCQIWCELLNRKSVGIHDNFMQIGANSLNLMQFVYLVYKKFGIDLPLGNVFEQPTIAEMAAFIDQHIKKQNTNRDIASEKQNGAFSLSPAQTRIYISHIYEECDTSYNLPTVLLIRGKLNVDKLEMCCRKLIEKHMSLRTAFYIKKDKLLQEVRNVEFSINRVQIKPCELDKYIINDFIRPFDLCTPPLFRMTVAQMGAEYFALLFDMHHIISDGWSQKLLMKDLLLLYQGLAIVYPEWSYQDYIIWLSEENQTIARQQDLEFWIKQFKVPSTVPNLPLSIDDTQPQNAGSFVSTCISHKLYSALQETARHCDSTLFTVMLGAYFVFLQSIGGVNDITIGVPIHGRIHPKLKKVIGLFTQMLPVRFLTGDHSTTGELVKELQKHMKDIYTHPNFDMDALVTQLNMMNINRPTIDAVFIMQDFEEISLSALDLDIQPYRLVRKSVRNKLVMEVIENKNESVEIHLDYQLRYFNQHMANQLLQQYIEVLDQLFSHQDIQLP